MDQMNAIDGVLLTPLEIIESDLGRVLHAMKQGDPGCGPFGEAYFSTIHYDAVKAWKRHRRLTSNIAVPVGEIRFVIVDDRTGDAADQRVMEVVLSWKNYQRLTIPPGLWMGFQGLGRELNLLLNIADARHDPSECEGLEPHSDRIVYRWSRLR
jgi:dTDP-4-dehydrorhamnose 3,5-epimerase